MAVTIEKKIKSKDGKFELLKLKGVTGKTRIKPLEKRYGGELKIRGDLVYIRRPVKKRKAAKRSAAGSANVKHVDIAGYLKANRGHLRIFRTPKRRTLSGKTYTVHAVTTGAQGLAVATYSTKYGRKMVMNYGIRTQLGKTVK